MKKYQNNYQFIAILIPIIICILLYIFFKNNDPIENFSKTTCVCVFDLDGTLTCGLDKAKIAVDECKKRNCKIAFNTARTSPYYKDIDINSLGLDESEFISDVYHGDWDKSTIAGSTAFFNGSNELATKIANTKTKHMKTIQDKYNVPPKRIILFDDVHENITSVVNSGFSGIHANNKQCGINNDVKTDISRILD